MALVRMVEAQETIRREELDIDTEGRTVEEKTGRLPSDRV
jgi:stress response protein YsnF